MLPSTDELPGSDLVPVAGGQAAQAPARVAADYLRSLVTGRKLRLGARTSPMAVAQAEHVAGLLGSLVPGLEVTISGINTTADQWADDLAALGGKKGLPVTLGVYGHVTEETFEQAREAIDRTLFRLRPVESSGTVTELRVAQ